MMEYATGSSAPANLTSAIVAFTPRDPNQPVIDHPFKREFLLDPLTEAQARNTVRRIDPASGRRRGVPRRGLPVPNRGRRDARSAVES